ncbi:MAG: hypothetical protein WBO23_01805 [Burkholderiales bacterium]
MKNPALRCAVTALLLLGWCPAHAADSYWYSGLGIGYSKVQFYPADFTAVGASFESKKEFDAGFKGFLGQQINRNWAAEVSYVSLGKFKFNGFDPSANPVQAVYKVTGWGFSALPTINFTDNLALYGRLGGFFSQTRTTIYDTNAGTNNGGRQSDEVSFLTGIGAQYFFGGDSGVRVEFENFGKVGEACPSSSPCRTGRANAKMISVNAIFAF